MQTRTEIYEHNSAWLRGIHRMEEAGWAVRQITTVNAIQVGSVVASQVAVVYEKEVER